MWSEAVVGITMVLRGAGCLDPQQSVPTAHQKRQRPRGTGEKPCRWFQDTNLTVFNLVIVKKKNSFEKREGISGLSDSTWPWL